MPQRFGLYEDLSVIENLNLYADLRGVTGAERRRAFERLLAFTDLARFTDRLAGKLSGGMKQKLGLACALIHPPQAPAARRAERGRRSRSRVASSGRWSTTSSTRASAWSGARPTSTRPSVAPRVILLNEGKVLDDGPPRDLTARVEGRSFLVHGAGPVPSTGPGRGPEAPRDPRRRHPGSERPAGRPARSDAAGPGRLRDRGDRDRAGRAAVRGRLHRPAGRRPEGRIAARRAGSPRRGRRHRHRGPRSDQAIRRLHRRRPDHASGSAGARSSACSAPTAPASRPRSR